MEKTKFTAEIQIATIQAFLLSVPGMPAKDVGPEMAELLTRQQIHVPDLKEALRSKTKLDLYILLLKGMVMPHLWEAGVLVPPFSNRVEQIRLLDTANLVLRHAADLFRTFDDVCGARDSRLEFLFTLIPTLMSCREQRDVCNCLHDNLLILMSLAIDSSQFKYIRDFEKYSSVAAKSLFFLTDALSNPANVPTLLDAFAELDVTPKGKDKVSIVAHIKDTAKTLDRKQLCQELLQLLPKSVIVIPTNSTLWGQTCIDGSIALNERMIIDASTYDDDKQRTEKEKIACTVFTLLHELGHKKLLMQANKGDYTVLTPRYFEYEAGNYLTLKGLGLKQSVTLTDICERRAALILDYRMWGSPGFQNFFLSDACVGHKHKSLYQIRAQNICGSGGRFCPLPTSPSEKELMALIEKALP